MTGELFFTFHDVSINTIATLENLSFAILFTFHDVSINTLSGNSLVDSADSFTLHDVSINTLRRCPAVLQLLHTLHSTMFLLIRTDIR